MRAVPPLPQSPVMFCFFFFFFVLKRDLSFLKIALCFAFSLRLNTPYFRILFPRAIDPSCHVDRDAFRARLLIFSWRMSLPFFFFVLL